MSAVIKTTKSISITSSIEIDNTQVEVVSANIDASDPTNANISRYISNQSVYKANRASIRIAEAKAEDDIYAEQDRLITEIGGSK